MRTISLWCTAKFIHRFGKQNHLRWAMARWWLKLVQDFSHQQYHWPYSSPRHAKSSKSFLKRMFFGFHFGGGSQVTHPTSAEFEAPKTHRFLEERTTIRAGCWDGDIHHLRDGKKHPKINGSFEAFQENPGFVPKNLGQGPIQHGYTWMEVTF